MKSEFSKWLKNRRAYKKMTMIDLAIASGVSQSYISEIESGKYEPTLSKADALCSGLGSSLPTALRQMSKDEG